MKGNFIYFSRCYVNSAYRLASLRLKGKKVNPQTIAGKKVIQDAENIIYDKVMRNQPFMMARYGSVELSIIVKYVTKQMGLIKEIPDKHMNVLCNNAGFFPNNKYLAEKFAELMIESSKQVDLLVAWNDIMEDYVIKMFAPQTQLIRYASMEPFLNTNPWSAALEGKKVLVIHPFEESIKHQYSKREVLFENQKVLPDFELKTLKAVQTIAGNLSGFETWFEAFQYMLEKVKGIDFDIAILGCGAYGFPLAAEIKKMGKQAVHLGGGTQILFGIKGKRWDNVSEIKKLYNQYWISPNESERPKDFNTIEGGCYW